MRILTLASLLSLAVAAADIRGLSPPGVKPAGPYTPGIVAGGLLYVSGQGARDAAGQLPATPEAQIRQCLENVRGIVTAGGLSMTHVVSTHVYLEDLRQFNVLNKLWSEYFPKDPPSRSVIGVSRMPTGTPVEIAAVAVVDLARRKAVGPSGQSPEEAITPAILVGDRLFFTGGLGRENSGAVPKEPRRQMQLVFGGAERVLKQAGLEMRHLAYANIYVDPGMPLKALGEMIDEFIPDETARTIIQTNALPYGIHIQVSGVASRDAQRTGGHCSSVKETVYCSGRVGTVRQTLETLKADLRVSKIDIAAAVSANVYLDDLDEFGKLNAVYGSYFGKVPPTRTTVQPWKRVAELSLPPATGAAAVNDDSPRGQISLIAVR